MSLNIESQNPRAENLNHVHDIYIYFVGAFYVWNWQFSEPLHVWYKGDQFAFRRTLENSAKELTEQFNEWVDMMNKEEKTQLEKQLEIEEKNMKEAMYYFNSTACAYNDPVRYAIGSIDQRINALRKKLQES